MPFDAGKDERLRMFLKAVVGEHILVPIQSVYPAATYKQSQCKPAPVVFVKKSIVSPIVMLLF